MEIFVSWFLHSSAQMCFYQTLGSRQPHISGRVMNTVTRVWVGDPHESAPLTFHGAVVRFAHRCLWKTRNLADSNYYFADLFSGRSWPNMCSPCFLATCFDVWNMFVEHQWSRMIHVPALLRTQVPLERYGRRGDATPGAMRTYPCRLYTFSAKVWAPRALNTP